MLLLDGILCILCLKVQLDIDVPLDAWLSVIEIMFIVHQVMSGKGLKKCEFVKPFYIMTNLISGSSYPTSNCYFMQVWKIECLLRENANSDDPTIKDMSLTMMNKFNKYWDHYYDILTIGAILDPRMKFEAI